MEHNPRAYLKHHEFWAKPYRKFSHSCRISSRVSHARGKRFDLDLETGRRPCLDIMTIDHKYVLRATMDQLSWKLVYGCLKCPVPSKISWEPSRGDTCVTSQLSSWFSSSSSKPSTWTTPPYAKGTSTPHTGILYTPAPSIRSSLNTPKKKNTSPSASSSKMNPNTSPSG